MLSLNCLEKSGSARIRAKENPRVSASNHRIAPKIPEHREARREWVFGRDTLKNASVTPD